MDESGVLCPFGEGWKAVWARRAQRPCLRDSAIPGREVPMGARVVGSRMGSGPSREGVGLPESSSCDPCRVSSRVRVLISH